MENKLAVFEGKEIRRMLHTGKGWLQIVPALSTEALATVG